MLTLHATGLLIWRFARGVTLLIPFGPGCFLQLLLHHPVSEMRICSPGTDNTPIRLAFKPALLPYIASTATWSLTSLLGLLYGFRFLPFCTANLDFSTSVLAPYTSMERQSIACTIPEQYESQSLPLPLLGIKESSSNMHFSCIYHFDHTEHDIFIVSYATMGQIRVYRAVDVRRGAGTEEKQRLYCLKVKMPEVV